MVKVGIVWQSINSLQSEKILDVTKLKAFADDKSYVAKMMLFDRVENTVGRGEKAGYQHLFLFQQCFLFHQRKLCHFS